MMEEANLRYIASTFVTVTMNPQYNNIMTIKEKSHYFIHYTNYEKLFR
jgi:hypothetical protein